MIRDRLIKNAMAGSAGARIKDIRVGLGYIYTLLDNGNSGLAYSFRGELEHCCSVLADAGDLIGQDSENIIPWLSEKNILKAAVGLSVVNAVLNASLEDAPEGNVIGAIRLKREEKFGMVGNFGPILPAVRKQTENIFVFERIEKERGGLYPERFIPSFLPGCDVVLISATSIINHTIDDVLSCCAGAREVFIVGPSTPLHVGSFADTNVSLLAGTVVTDPERMLRIISQGGGTMQMKPASRHVLVNAAA